jgi:hypothetical protein
MEQRKSWAVGGAVAGYPREPGRRCAQSPPSHAQVSLAGREAKILPHGTDLRSRIPPASSIIWCSHVECAVVPSRSQSASRRSAPLRTVRARSQSRPHSPRNLYYRHLESTPLAIHGLQRFESGIAERQRAPSSDPLAEALSGRSARPCARRRLRGITSALWSRGLLGLRGCR